jgi:hypothetical protein
VLNRDCRRMKRTNSKCRLLQVKSWVVSSGTVKGSC